MSYSRHTLSFYGIIFSTTLGIIACGSSGSFAGGGSAARSKPIKKEPEVVSPKPRSQHAAKVTINKPNKSETKTLGHDDEEPAYDVQTDEDGETETAADTAVRDITATLENLRWDFPCSGPGLGICRSPSQVSVQKALAGEPNLLYSIELRFRGIVETKAYNGGSNDGSYFQIGGSPTSGLANIYQLEISDPPQVYYLNRQHSFGDKLAQIDFTKTVEVYGGATVRLFADAVDSLQLGNTPGYIVPGVEDTPYNGQFIQMNVVSITASKQ